MPHGLTLFNANDIIDKVRGALEISEQSADGGSEARWDSMHEALRVALENQIAIAETLDRIKSEFDKFEQGLNKIL